MTTNTDTLYEKAEKLSKFSGVGWWYCMDVLKETNENMNKALKVLAKTRTFLRKRKYHEQV